MSVRLVLFTDTGQYWQRLGKAGQRLRLGPTSDLAESACSVCFFACLPRRARYCKVSRAMVSTVRSWLLVMPRFSRVFSGSWLPL